MNGYCKGRRAILTSTTKGLKPWQAQVATVAKIAQVEFLEKGVPVIVDMLFYFERPKSHFGTGRNAGILKKKAPEYHTQKPDKDKLGRAVHDALTGIAYHDDSQVIGGKVFKYWTDEIMCDQGVLITIRKVI